VGEFYMCAMENGTGNPNDRGNFPTVLTQRERAHAFTATLHALTRLPYVVGADWFQYYDEPPKGRFDAENFNMGLVHVLHHPYGHLTARAASLALLRPKPHPAPKPADAHVGIPRATRDPMVEFRPQPPLKHWNRDRGFVPPLTRCPMADLYVCWQPDALFLG